MYTENPDQPKKRIEASETTPTEEPEEAKEELKEEPKKEAAEA